MLRLNVENRGPKMVAGIKLSELRRYEGRDLLISSGNFIKLHLGH